MFDVCDNQAKLSNYSKFPVDVVTGLFDWLIAVEVGFIWSMNRKDSAAAGCAANLVVKVCGSTDIIATVTMFPGPSTDRWMVI